MYENSLQKQTYSAVWTDITYYQPQLVQLFNAVRWINGRVREILLSLEEGVTRWVQLRKT